MDRYLTKLIVGSMDGRCVAGGTNYSAGWIDRYLNGWIDRWMDGLQVAWMNDEWLDEQMTR